MNSTVKTVVFWVVILLSALLLWQVVRRARAQKDKEITFSELLLPWTTERQRSDDSVGHEVQGKYKNDNPGSTPRRELP